MPNHDDRRVYVRRMVNLRVELRVDGAVIEAKTKDLSQGGVRLLTPTPLKVNQTLGLDLFLINEVSPDDMTGPLDLRGTVVWVKPLPGGKQEIGVRFASPSDVQDRWLKRYMDAIADVE